MDHLFWRIVKSIDTMCHFYMTPEESKEVGSESFDPKKTKITENRYYFLNGKMIRWLDEAKKQIDTRTTEFEKAETEILDFSNQLIAKSKKT
jgi:hypothetical protein